jgi:membrane associated rhomboid family serine protease
MTSESRDYFRGERALRFEGWGGTPATWALILVLAILWLVYAGTVNRIAPGGTIHRAFQEQLSLTARRVVEDGRVWQLGTHFFLHGPTAAFHVLFSLLFLFFLGRPLERMLGRGPYVRLFLSGGFFAGILAVPWLYLVGREGVPVASASGAVYAVSIGVLLRTPDEDRFMGVPGWGIALFLVVLNLVFLAVFDEVLHFFPLAGAGFAWLHLRGAARWARWRESIAERSAQRRAQREAGREDDRRRRVDTLLEKIEKEGIASLSAEEKGFLQKASRRFR